MFVFQGEDLFVIVSGQISIPMPGDAMGNIRNPAFQTQVDTFQVNIV